MRTKRGRIAAFAVGAGLLAAASPAFGAGSTTDKPAALPDRDVRSAELRPTAAQRADARAIGTQVAWNQFGTPSSIVDPGGTLAVGVPGGSAEAAARAFVDANADLFRGVAAAQLQLVNDSALAGGAGHAVTLRQVVGGLEAAGGGMLTVGVRQEGATWKVISAAGSLHGDATLAGKATLSAQDALQRAAADTGERRTLGQIDRLSKPAGGFKAFAIAGIDDVQRVRAVAFPTVGRGFVPAFETYVVDSGAAAPTGYRSYVDARDGTVLARESLVDQAADEEVAAALAPVELSGTLPATDGGCAPQHGPYAVAADAGIRAIDVFVDADTPAQDIVLRLYRGATLLVEADTGFTPERIRYQPAGNVVPAGDYFVEVCEFANGTPPVEPRTYTGTIAFDDSPAPAPYTARWLDFANTPLGGTLARDPWNVPDTDVREHWCWTRSSGPAADCDEIVGNLASRSPWDHDVKANVSTGTTFGNNALAAESWGKVPEEGEPEPPLFHPTSRTRDYSFPFTDAWNNADCNPGTNFGAFVSGQSFDISAAVTNLFVQHNRMHDWSYLLGFTEQNWNAQDANFGLTELAQENDPVVGFAQQGAASPDAYLNRNNANMSTLPDGSSSVTNMYLWQPLAGAFYAPCVDGDFDAGVIGHEYGHMIENRMIGKGVRRTGHHAGAMGESVGDLMSIEQLNEHGFLPTDGSNRWATGTYATGNKFRGIRNFAGNWPSTGTFPAPGVQPQVDPLNFSDIGYDLTGPQVHADGEIWTATNFDIRKALAAKYDAQYPESDTVLQERCAKGAVPVDQCPGNRRWIQLVLDSFLLMPANPSMVDARNAQLAADTMRFGGANETELWAAFARRGLGEDAAATNGTGRALGVESDTNPRPDFAAPEQPNAAITFAATTREAPQTPVNARVFVGHFEARVSPVADTDPATGTAAPDDPDNLDATAGFAPGTYEFIATAPGYGAVRFRRTFAAGAEQTISIRMAPNLASKTQGATAAGHAAPVMSGSTEVLSAQQVRDRLIDDSEATNWQGAAYQNGQYWTVNNRRVTVDLAGTAPRTINRVQVSALLGPVYNPSTATDLTQNRFTALREFEVWTCNDRVANCATDAGFNRAMASAADAFPSDAPRPVAPTLSLREFTFSPVVATHVQLVARKTQCSGGPAYQGEQDRDPVNKTDCDTAAPDATHFVRASELQVYGLNPQIQVSSG